MKLTKPFLIFLLISILFWLAMTLITPHVLRFAFSTPARNDLEISDSRIQMVTIVDYTEPDPEAILNRVKNSQVAIGTLLALNAIAGFVFYVLARAKGLKVLGTMCFILLFAGQYAVAEVYHSIYFFPFHSDGAMFFFRLLIPGMFSLILFSGIYKWIFKKEYVPPGKYELHKKPMETLMLILMVISSMIGAYYLTILETTVKDLIP